MSSNVSKPNYSRSISVKPQKNAFEYENDGELTTIYLNYPPRELSRSTSTSKVNSKSQPKPIKYRKSSSSRSNTLFKSSRSSSYHALSSNPTIERQDSSESENQFLQSKISEKLSIISQQNFYLLQQNIPNSFIVCGESSSRYLVTVGPQTCCCLTKSGINVPSFPCVHILFVMCKVLQVHDKDPLLLATHLKKVEVDELFQRFNKRRKEKLKNPYRPNERNYKNHNEELDVNIAVIDRSLIILIMQFHQFNNSMNRRNLFSYHCLSQVLVLSQPRVRILTFAGSELEATLVKLYENGNLHLKDVEVYWADSTDGKERLDEALLKTYRVKYVFVVDNEVHEELPKENNAQSSNGNYNSYAKPCFQRSKRPNLYRRFLNSGFPFTNACYKRTGRPFADYRSYLGYYDY